MPIFTWPTAIGPVDLSFSSSPLPKSHCCKVNRFWSENAPCKTIRGLAFPRVGVGRPLCHQRTQFLQYHPLCLFRGNDQLRQVIGLTSPSWRFPGKSFDVGNPTTSFHKVLRRCFAVAFLHGTASGLINHRRQESLRRWKAARLRKLSKSRVVVPTYLHPSSLRCLTLRCQSGTSLFKM